jgi:hypothetical protein
MHWKDRVKSAWDSTPATVVLVTLYPTLFVLSNNWYALKGNQIVWLVGVAIAAGLAMFAILELAFRAFEWLAPRWLPQITAHIRPIVFGIVCGAVMGLLLTQTIKSTLHNSRPLVIAVYIALGALFVYVFSRHAQRQANAFLSLFSVVACVNWAVSAMDTSQSWLSKVRQDFEHVEFKHKPNIYLFIYDAYSSADAYTKVFNFDNSQHYADLDKRGFKVLHTFSNYTSTLQTTISVFLGMHHYYSTETGFNDSQNGRPLLAGVVHNPTLATLKSNGYRIQYIHGIDYFVNEQGVLDYMFPDKPISSSLRVFGVPLLKMKRRIGLEAQMEALYPRIHPTPKPGEAPWFTFAHVNLPAHSNMEIDWRGLGAFEQQFRDRTKLANTNMLETIDRIRTTDPEAVILIFGDHGAHRYNRLAAVSDPNAAFKEAGVTPEKAALDDFGIMIAVGSGGRCNDEVYTGMTPVNMLRSLFSCLSEDPALLDNRAADISLYRAKGGSKIFKTAEDGKALPEWKEFEQIWTPFN